ncbi:septum site-determining protein MinC [Albimonas sp. CAU 1670]|uniref:septum site-determining protein MinC n=1 Tax=Albimonas sp. CAU 1670 TaxID=3032599 RepID=UPI0023DA73C2|nr:septum site-determining protein MinC [Albimonas sp. CAU 1670]MDF2231475.1 septum site-determining protein MinC [Albimonas sp. CAU 1670]
MRGRFLTAVALPVGGPPGLAYLSALDDLLRQSPGFFSDAPLVLDLAQAEGLDADGPFVALLRDLRARGLNPFAVQNATEAQGAAASRAGLANLPAGRDAALPRKPAPVEASPEPDPEPVDPGPGTVLVTEPVRSGQRIYAERGDVIVVGSVSSGAEIIAHGNVHVYGRLRGRALAGVHGDASARIFCQSLEAELIAIAGLYKTREEIGDGYVQQPVQAFLEDDALRIVTLK